MPWREAPATSDGRTLTVRVVGWDAPAMVDDGDGPYREAFDPGSLELDPAAGVCPVYAWHDPVTRTRGPLIGRVAMLDLRSDGAYGTVRVADTADGRDSLALIADEVVPAVSAEFTPVDDRPGPDGLVIRTRALLTGLALAVRPAHPSAAVVAVRSSGAQPMPTTATTPDPTRPLDPDNPDAPRPDDDDDDDETAGALDDQTRARAARQSLAAVRSGATSTVAAAPPSPAPRWRTFGEFAYDVYRGRVPAGQREAMYRALMDVTTADVPGLIPPATLRRIVQVMDAAMPLVNAWSSVPLPASGMSIIYPSITQRPLVDLVVGEKVAIPSRDTKISALTTPVQTFAGGEDTSIQVLERSDPSYWSLAYNLYLREMALKVEAAAGAALVAAAPGAGTGIGTDPTGFNAALAGLAAAMFTSSGGVFPDTMTVGIGVWEAFAGASDPDGRPLFPGVSPVNPVGRTDITTPDGQARGLTFAVSAGLPPDTGVMGSREAFVTMLGPVSTLMADNPEKLGRDSAVYRFGAFAALDPTALVEFNLGAPVAARATAAKKA